MAQRTVRSVQLPFPGRENGNPRLLVDAAVGEQTCTRLQLWLFGCRNHRGFLGAAGTGGRLQLERGVLGEFRGQEVGLVFPKHSLPSSKVLRTSETPPWLLLVH